ncbi:MAG: hypothetical protein HY453_01120 [Parcubacteria group bacterium]|nr:hypothetical protein [Parcubacteria group bacterium]
MVLKRFHLLIVETPPPLPRLPSKFTPLPFGHLPLSKGRICMVWPPLVQGEVAGGVCFVNIELTVPEPEGCVPPVSACTT